jgi:amidase
VLEEGFGGPSGEKDVDVMVRDAAARLGSAGASVANVSIPMHRQAGSIMMTSVLDGALSTFTELGPNGPNPRGHSMVEAIRCYYKAQ